jgi:ferredoxin
MKVPVIELGDCILCEVCTGVCPSVFRMNAAGYVEILPLDLYPEEQVDEAIKNCPAQCIFWED